MASAPFLSWTPLDFLNLCPPGRPRQTRAEFRPEVVTRVSRSFHQGGIPAAPPARRAAARAARPLRSGATRGVVSTAEAVVNARSRGRLRRWGRRLALAVLALVVGLT